MNIIENEWITFKGMVIPDDAPTIQLVEMKRAFFVGALVAINNVIELAAQNKKEDVQEMLFQVLTYLDGVQDKAYLNKKVN